MESAESRFAHLLQPIRELTKNWDIDVAAELNDYLEEVREVPRFSDCWTEHSRGSGSSRVPGGFLVCLLQPCDHVLVVTPSLDAQEGFQVTKPGNLERGFQCQLFLCVCDAYWSYLLYLYFSKNPFGFVLMHFLRHEPN